MILLKDVKAECKKYGLPLGRMNKGKRVPYNKKQLLEMLKIYHGASRTKYEPQRERVVEKNKENNEENNEENGGYELGGFMLGGSDDEKKGGSFHDFVTGFTLPFRYAKKGFDAANNIIKSPVGQVATKLAFGMGLNNPKQQPEKMSAGALDKKRKNLHKMFSILEERIIKPDIQKLYN